MPNALDQWEIKREIYWCSTCVYLGWSCLPGKTEELLPIVLKEKQNRFIVSLSIIHSSPMNVTFSCQIVLNTWVSEGHVDNENCTCDKRLMCHGFLVVCHPSITFVGPSKFASSRRPGVLVWNCTVDPPWMRHVCLDSYSSFIYLIIWTHIQQFCNSHPMSEPTRNMILLHCCAAYQTMVSGGRSKI